MKKRCCFAGHSKIFYTEAVYHAVVHRVETLITEEKVSEFWVGNYGNFDALCARAVRSLKEKYPEIELCLVLPYLTADINRDKERYQTKYDRILLADIPKQTPKKFQILKCNTFMVDNADFLLCYTQLEAGGAAKTVEYARKKTQTKVWNIAAGCI